MTIVGEDVGKKFGKNWIFRHQNFEISSNQTVAITGKNGAGKSTLLQIVSGFLSPSEGVIQFNNQSTDDAKALIEFIGPYTELIEEFTLQELLTFHSHFKKPLSSFSEMADAASLVLDKPISSFSTGMKQRVKLILSFYFQNSLLLMDEPTANLDEEGIKWWKEEVEKVMDRQLIIIASNQKEEISLCSEIIQLQ